MRYLLLNRYTDSEFKRLVGVPREISTKIVEVFNNLESLKKK